MRKLFNGYKKLEFKQKGDERGNLVVIEGNVDIPFKVKRIFYIYGSDTKVIRGEHANRKTEFVLINVSGSSKVKIDDGFNKTVIELNNPNQGIYIPTMVWKDMYDFSSDSVLLVLASEHYDKEEYIRDYDMFLKETLNNDKKALK